MSKKSAFGGMILGAILTLIAIEYLNLNVQILHNIGVVKSNIGVYWDSACTNETKIIDWGILNPGSEASVIVYLANNKNSSATVTLSLDHWNPLEAQYYLTITWNCSYSMSANEVCPVKLTLKVDESITGIKDFSFDIIITATWY